MKSHNWYKQSPAIAELQELSDKEEYDKNELFILGRNFLQTTNGGENLANEIIKSIPSWIEKFSTKDGENYFLDGILYEIYFDHNGIFRDKNLKDRLIDYIIPLQKMDSLEKSFRFIEKELLPFTNRNFYFLKYKNEPLQFNLVFEKTIEDGEDIYTLDDVVFEGVSVLKTDNSNWFLEDGDTKYQPILRANLEAKISQLAKVPKGYIALISNYDHEINQSSKINIPLSKIIRK